MDEGVCVEDAGDKLLGSVFRVEYRPDGEVGMIRRDDVERWCDDSENIKDS